MNTVGKAGKLGEHVKCVISVSMLTEGWDANKVMHVLGRAGIWHPTVMRASGRAGAAENELRGR